MLFAIPDHPWVDNANGAVCEVGHLLTVTSEQTGEHGVVNVALSKRSAVIHADWKIGASLTDIKPLQANQKLSDRGVKVIDPLGQSAE